MVQYVKKVKGWKIYSWLVVLLASIFFAPCEAFSQGKDYAVEVAALAARDCADELVNGLVARGLDAYWLKSNQGQFGDFYRVRIGKFPDLDLARNFADNLLDSGLLDTCSITVYEAPSYSLMMRDSKGGQTDLLPLGMRNTPLGSYCPINLSAISNKSNKPEEIISSLSNGATVANSVSGEPARDIDMKKTIDAVIASTQASISSIRPRVNMALNLNSIAAGVNKAVDKQLISVPSVDRELTPAPSQSAAASASSAAPAPAVYPKTERSSFTGNIRPAGGSTVSGSGYVSGPRLRGYLEMSNGKMLLKLQNLDQERSFSGLARITLSDDGDSNDIAPLPLDLKPQEEKVLPLNDMKQAHGDLMLMVYDQRQTVQLIRSIPFGQRPKTSVAENRVEDRSADNPVGDAAAIDPSSWKITDAGGSNSPSVETGAGVAQQRLPNVTGSFDATGAPSGSGDSNSAPQNNTQNANAAPGQLVVSPRQISGNSSSVTMEVGIKGEQPIGYVKVLIRAGNFQDEKIAVFPTANAAVPFLVPANDAKGQYSYEVRNDAGELIGNGTRSFSPVGPDS
jgi:hypothetical protein